jgi:Ecdysteroid kinase-like family
MRKTFSKTDHSAEVSQSNPRKTLNPINKFDFLSFRLLYVDKNALVLEDLTCMDYKLANRKVRFDLSQAKKVLEKLALFHASTASIHAKDSSSMKRYESSLIECEESPLVFFFSVSMEETLQTIRETPDLQQYESLLENFDIVQRERGVFQRNSGDKFHVLNHGDLWINNIFFANDEKGHPTDAMLVSKNGSRF